MSIVERARNSDTPDMQARLLMADLADEIERLRVEVKGHLKAWDIEHEDNLRLRAERDAYKGTLRYLAGEGVTAARRVLEEK